MKNLVKFSFIAMIAFLAYSCSDDDDNSSLDDNQTTAEFIATTPEFSSLAAALERTGLTANFQSGAELTLFAPTNDAFSTFLNNNGFSSLEEVPEDLLRETLLNHVVSGDNEAADLTTGYFNSLATYANTDNNLSMYVDTSAGVKLNGLATVTEADIETESGVVHKVDAVITLPTVVTFATADSNFETLVSALTLQGQPDYVTTLSTGIGTDPAPFTVFAPTNKAFADLLVELNITSLNEIDSATLTAALNTHVIAGQNVLAEDLTTGTVTTLGAAVEVDAENGTITDPNDRISTIVVTNVQASNGVIHAIDNVLLPQL